MLSGIKRLFQSVETVTGLMTRGALYDYHQNDLELANGYSMLDQDDPPKALSQQLIDDLAELREDTTIIGRDPSEEARSRLMRPFYEPGASLPWPPVYPPAPLRYDFYADRYSEESSSTPSSVTPELSDRERWNVYVGSPVFQPKAPSPTPRIIPHIIGEDDPFNPFSYDLMFEDKNARSIDTPSGKIFAPVPTRSTAAAIANFETIALTEMVPTVEGVVNRESFQNKDDSMSSDEKTTGSMSSSEIAGEGVDVPYYPAVNCRT